MNIWTCKRSILAVCLVLLTASCEEGPFAGSDFGFLSGGAADGRKNVSLRRATLADGDVVIVPPPGFCVDSRSIATDFAVLARCDSLGGRIGRAQAPLGLLTVAVAVAPEDVAIETLQPVALSDDAKVLDARTTGDLRLIQIEAPPVFAGSDRVSWRGVTQIGRYVLSLAAYAPDGGSLAGDGGSEILQTLSQQMRQASPVVATSQDSTPIEAAPMGGLFRRLGALIRPPESSDI